MNRFLQPLAALVLLALCLVFTPLALLLLFHSWVQYECVIERHVENRTGGTIWVTPVAHGSERSYPFRHYPSRWPTYAGAPTNEIEIPPGESRRLLADRNTESDVSDRSLLVRTANGETFYDSLSRSTIVVKGHTQRHASAEVVAAAMAPRPAGVRGVPAGVILALGVGSPLVIWRLLRATRSTSL